MTRIIIIALICALLAVSSESKGEESMKGPKFVKYSVVSGEQGETVIRLPIVWDDDYRDVKLWVDLGGHLPSRPRVMPYVVPSQDGTVKKHATRSLGFVFKVVPGKYTLNIKVEYTASNGSTHTTEQKMAVVIPSVSELAPRKSVGTTTGAAVESEIAGAPKKPKRIKADVVVQIKKNGTQAEYEYRVHNSDDDTPISSVIYRASGAAEVSGTPKGWRPLLNPDGKGVVWSAEAGNQIQPGKSQGGFRVRGSVTQDNADISLVGGEGTTSAATIGPGN